MALQLFHAINFCHSKGVTFGEQLCPDRIFVQDDGWIRLVIPSNACNEAPESLKSKSNNRAQGVDEMSAVNRTEIDDDNEGRTVRRSIFNRYDNSTSFDSMKNNRGADQCATVIPYPGYGDVPMVQWQKGQITNLAYLMMLNAAAGRCVIKKYICHRFCVLMF